MEETFIICYISNVILNIVLVIISCVIDYKNNIEVIFTTADILIVPTLIFLLSPIFTLMMSYVLLTRVWNKPLIKISPKLKK